MSEALLLEAREGPVVRLTLNRPEKLNALSRALVSALTQAFKRLSADDGLRAIVLTGAGRAFCAGVDLKEIAAADDVAGAFDWTGGDDLLSVLRACPHPVIAAVNGPAITGGLELALMADMIVASERAVFADTHARVGITPSWGMTQVLPRLIGPMRARQMSLTGEFVDAARAAAWGLANEVVPADALLQRAHALAAQVAETDAATMSRIRGLIAHAQDLPLNEGLAREVEVFAEHVAQVKPDAVAAARERVTARGRSLAGRD